VRRAALAAVAAALVVAGCGSSSSASKPTLTVSAAASLKKAFGQCADTFKDANVRFSFAGSDELAAQIRQGARPDVYAAANTKLPQQLAQGGLLDPPLVFAGNRLVIAVPADSQVTSVEQLGRPGTKLVIGEKDVPVGWYTQDVLARLPAAQRQAILANVRSQEPDVLGIVGKLAQGAADAGFLYVTDVVAAGDRLRAIELPARLQPRVQYGIGVVKGSQHAEQAKAFIDSLTHGTCRQVMHQAGFEPPPG
jgi:molybdate transport system substrate-binding protein